MRTTIKLTYMAIQCIIFLKMSKKGDEMMGNNQKKKINISFEKYTQNEEITKKTADKIIKDNFKALKYLSDK